MRASAASETARRVAAQRLTFTRVPAPYGEPEADTRLAAHVAGDLDGTTGNLRDYLEARTSFFDRVVVDSLGRGITQVVVGAAGYDGRALRYAKPGVRWFEVDHPATQHDKLERLADLEIAVAHIHFVAADFDRDRFGAALTNAGLRVDEPSLFLLEGVAVYLRRATLESVLAELRAVAGPGSRLAISLSASAASPEQAARRAAFRAGVAALGEPALTTITPDGAASLLGASGWRASRPAAGDIRPDRARSAGFVIAEPGAVPSSAE